MVKALESIQNGNVSRMCMFLGLTIAGGVIFLGLQAYEWTHLIKHGLTLTGLPEHGLKSATISGSTLFWSNVLRHHRVPRDARDRGGRFISSLF